MENRTQIPLLSFRDARLLVILQLFCTPVDKKKTATDGKKHKKRESDITKIRPHEPEQHK